jgi:4-amino-4-deoxychorismate lyase
MESWLVNGQRSPVVDAGDRGLAYGDGLFETIAIRQGVPRLFDSHMARLLDGCRRLALPDPSAQRINDEIAQLTRGHVRGVAKVIVTRGVGPRGYRPPADSTPTRVIGFIPEDGDKSRNRSRGVHIIACRTPFSCNPALAGLKTLNRLDSVLARSEWQDDGVSEGLMCDTADRVIGGTMSNVFVARGGRLLTPVLDQCGVRGIMRGLVLKSARTLGLPAAEARIGVREIAEADELFLTNALIGLWPVISCGSRVYEVGPVTRAIAAALAARGIEECEECEE